ncbi:UNVERIFIED_CONTAM: hypothetical protein K2H54_036436 [Gekko kuhli]
MGTFGVKQDADFGTSHTLCCQLLNRKFHETIVGTLNVDHPTELRSQVEAHTELKLFNTVLGTFLAISPLSRRQLKWGGWLDLQVCYSQKKNCGLSMGQVSLP